MPTHVIYASKLPYASTNVANAAFTHCVYAPYNGKLHGFCPTASALDIHESWNTSLLRQPDFNLTPANQNLLIQNDYNGLVSSPHHNFGYPHISHPSNHYDITPFDAVCANGDFDNSYYYDNTIHIEDPNPYVAEFLVEEIAPSTLYLSNRTIHDETTEKNIMRILKQEILYWQATKIFTNTIQIQTIGINAYRLLPETL